MRAPSSAPNDDTDTRGQIKGKASPLIAVFADPNDKYSSGLSGFVSAVTQSQGGRIVPETYTSGVTYTTGVTTNFRAQARDVVGKRVDLIYFAGLAREALLLARALDAIGAPADLRIVSDDGFYNPSAFVALPGHKSRFVFTGFFYPDQATLVRDPGARTVIQDMEDPYRMSSTAPTCRSAGMGPIAFRRVLRWPMMCSS